MSVLTQTKTVIATLLKKGALGIALACLAFVAVFSYTIEFLAAWFYIFGAISLLKRDRLLNLAVYLSGAFVAVWLRLGTGYGGFALNALFLPAMSVVFGFAPLREQDRLNGEAKRIPRSDRPAKPS